MANYSRELAAFDNIDRMANDIIDEQLYSIEKAVPGRYTFGRRKIRQFKGGVAREEWFQVKLGESLRSKTLKDLWTDLPVVFSHLLQEVPANDEDLIRVHIRHNDLTKGDIKVRMQPRGQLTANSILSRLEEVLQSHQSLTTDDSFEIGIGVIHIPSGSGRTKVHDLHSNTNSLTRKKSVVEIRNKDQICLARAIAVGLGYIKWQAKQMSKADYDQLKDPRMRQQEYAALSLHDRADVPTDRPCTLQDVAKFERALGIQIVVMGAAQGSRVIYTGEDKAIKVFVLLVSPEGGEGPGHFHAITKPAGFLGNNYFCNKCLRSYRNQKTHKCDFTCVKCKSQNCPKGEEVHCVDCNVTCQSQVCFDAHKESSFFKSGKRKGQLKSVSVCETFWQCVDCKRILERKKRSPAQHTCGEWLCPCCQEYVLDVNHKCYLRRLQPKEARHQYIFFDAECMQETGVHIPNLIVAHVSCSTCIETESSTCLHCGQRCLKCGAWDSKQKEYATVPCDGCGQREVVFKGRETQYEFGRWLFQPCHAGYTVLAHNMKGYDGYFLLDHLVSNSIRHDVIFSGSKIMSITVHNGLSIRVIDSVNFLPMALKKLPKAFDLDTEKGEFPHWFNTEVNQDYIGPYPDPQFYGVDYMAVEDRASFIEWFKKQDGKTFNFQAEILKYCQADVQVLRKACMQFRNLLMSITDIDPFQYLTVASVCMAIYRTKFLCEQYEVQIHGCTASLPAVLKGDQLQVFVNGQWSPAKDLQITSKKFIRSPIGQVPAAGYVKFENYSKESIQWLEWLMEVRRREGKPLHIQHALNGGEHLISGTNYRADGWCRDTKTVYEFSLSWL